MAQENKEESAQEPVIRDPPLELTRETRTVANIVSEFIILCRSRGNWKGLLMIPGQCASELTVQGGGTARRMQHRYIWRRENMDMNIVLAHFRAHNLMK